MIIARRYLSLVATFVLACVLLAPSSSVAAEFNLQTASFAEINKAFDAGALTSEKLVSLCLARIKAYDQTRPKLNAVIPLNPNALEITRALHPPRKTTSPR